MTNREFYEKIVAGNFDAELTAHAEAQIEKLDAANAKRSAKQKEKQEANMALMNDLIGYLTTDPQTASDLCGAIEESVQKTSSLLRMAVAEGKCSVKDVKVPKKGTQKGYFLEAVEDTGMTAPDAAF